jgi:hypothetical protein
VNKLFVDGRSFFTQETALIGADIKKLAGTSSYHLYLESSSKIGDKFVEDGEAVRLDEKICHFFVVPPATI